MNDEWIADIFEEVQEILVTNRDARISIVGRRNGLVIGEKNGENSNIIRMGTPEVIRYAIKRYKELENA